MALEGRSPRLSGYPCAPLCVAGGAPVTGARDWRDSRRSCGARASGGALFSVPPRSRGHEWPAPPMRRGSRRAEPALGRRLGFWLSKCACYRRSLLAQESACIRSMGERKCAMSHSPSRHGHEGAAPVRRVTLEGRSPRLGGDSCAPLGEDGGAPVTGARYRRDSRRSGGARASGGALGSVPPRNRGHEWPAPPMRRGSRRAEPALGRRLCSRCLSERAAPRLVV